MASELVNFVDSLRYIFNNYSPKAKLILLNNIVGLLNSSILQISGQQFSRGLIGSLNSEYPLDFQCFGTELKMASRFATVSKDEIFAVNETAAPTNTKKQTKIGLSVFAGR